MTCALIGMSRKVSCQQLYEQPSNVINYIYYLTARRKGLQRLWLHPHDRYHAVTQAYNNSAETQLGGGVMGPFVSLLSAIAAWSNCHWQCSSQERPMKILSTS